MKAEKILKSQATERAESYIRNFKWMISEKLITQEEYRNHINTLAIRLVDREIWVGGLSDAQILELYLERMTIQVN